MKFSKMNLKYVLIVMASVALFSCSKTEEGAMGPMGNIGPTGEIGPAGPAGENGTDGQNGGVDGADGVNGQDGQDGAAGVAGQDGAPGVAGQDGTNGIDGQDGNANVITSGWIATDFDASASTSSSFSVTDPDITGSLADTGIILAYGKRRTNNIITGESISIKALPYTNGSKDYTISLLRENSGFGAESYKFYFVGATTDGSTAIFDYFFQVRYVIIPASTSGKLSINFKKMTYGEVMDHFGLDH